MCSSLWLCTSAFFFLRFSLFYLILIVAATNVAFTESGRRNTAGARTTRRKRRRRRRRRGQRRRRNSRRGRRRGRPRRRAGGGEGSGTRAHRLRTRGGARVHQRELGRWLHPHPRQQCMQGPLPCAQNPTRTRAFTPRGLRKRRSRKRWVWGLCRARGRRLFFHSSNRNISMLALGLPAYNFRT